MVSEGTRVTWGQVRLAEAMIREGHCPTDAERETKSGSGTISNVLAGHRGVGVDLGLRIAARYKIPIEDFRRHAPMGTSVPEVPRGTRRSSTQPPEAQGGSDRGTTCS